MMSGKRVSLFGGIIAIAAVSVSNIPNAMAETTVGYWTSTSGEIVRNGFGQCYRTQLWEPKNAIAACESDDLLDTDKDGVTNNIDDCPEDKPGVIVDLRGCELDDDNDGLVNSFDSCPDTLVGTEVDAAGCAVIETDMDRDGIADTADECPSSMVGAQVDIRGCELDSDGDRVVDSRDQCSGTLIGQLVDVNGCKLIEKLTLKHVNFDTDFAVLQDGIAEMLDKVAETLIRHQDMIIEISGHTDSLGGHTLNDGLSERRAAMVANYLLSKGVSSESLQTKGYGSNSPVASNRTAAGRSQNRRVELHIVQQPRAQEFQFSLDL